MQTTVAAALSVAKSRFSNSASRVACDVLSGLGSPTPVTVGNDQHSWSKVSLKHPFHSMLISDFLHLHQILPLRDEHPPILSIPHYISSSTLCSRTRLTCHSDGPLNLILFRSRSLLITYSPLARSVRLLSSSYSPTSDKLLKIKTPTKPSRRIAFLGPEILALVHICILGLSLLDPSLFILLRLPRSINLMWLLSALCSCSLIALSTHALIISHTHRATHVPPILTHTQSLESSSSATPP
jgi:hypothetical protein